MKTQLLLLSIVLLVGAYPVRAARLVPQTGPTSTPVQSLPEGTVPNYKGNINYSAPDSVSPEASSDGSQPTFFKSSEQQANVTAGQGNQPFRAKKGNVGLFIALALIVAGVGGYVYFRNKQA